MNCTIKPELPFDYVDFANISQTYESNIELNNIEHKP